jgi:hypothetical protein
MAPYKPSRARKRARPRRVLILEVEIAGTAYYDMESVLSAVRRGHKAVLRREPNNLHDKMAVEVYLATGAKLGYIPRLKNDVLARIMDGGLSVSAEITDVGYPLSDYTVTEHETYIEIMRAAPKFRKVNYGSAVVAVYLEC